MRLDSREAGWKTVLKCDIMTAWTRAVQRRDRGSFLGHFQGRIDQSMWWLGSRLVGEGLEKSRCQRWPRGLERPGGLPHRETLDSHWLCPLPLTLQASGFDPLVRDPNQTSWLPLFALVTQVGGKAKPFLLAVTMDSHLPYAHAQHPVPYSS